ncbi:MAG: glycosyltransferase family 2 protein [Anaerolineae bacterium]|nr:glycosyltransferase family 2 protein [Anaerolineae bacterium]
MSVEQPKVSIIIPAYFSGKTIEASLQSFCHQDYENYEVIVVDSSHEGITEELVRKKFPQVRIHHPSGRLLPHAARNVGVTYAKGELFIFTDPDIYAPPNWIRLLVNGFENMEELLLVRYPITGTDGSKWECICASLMAGFLVERYGP